VRRFRLASSWRRAAAIVAVIAVVAGGAAVARSWADGGSAAPRYAGTALRGGHRYDFALQDQNGHEIRMSRLRGKIVLLTFLFTRCRDVCPMVAAALSDAVRSLGPERGQVRVVAVSVDPDGDTPAAVRAYVRQHRLPPQFEWLIGSRTALAPIWQNYNIEVEPQNIDKIVHAAPVYLLDRSGVPRVLFAPPQNVVDIEHDLRLSLRS
jgi:protein SCO1